MNIHIFIFKAPLPIISYCIIGIIAVKYVKNNIPNDIKFQAIKKEFLNYYCFYIKSKK
jgi:hypothetical protein